MNADPYEPAFGFPTGPWFRGFAWWPVWTLDRGWRWLRPVWFRQCQSRNYLSGPTVWWFQATVTDPRSTP